MTTSAAPRRRPRKLSIAGMDRAVTRPAVIEHPASRVIVIRALRSLALELYDHHLVDAGDYIDRAADYVRDGDEVGERGCLELAIEIEPKIGRCCMVEGLLR